MRRFSLAQLLICVFACCVYLAAVRSFNWLDPLDEDVGRATWPFVITQFVMWLILSTLYCYWRLAYAMGIHSAFAIYGVFIYILFLLGGGFEFVLSGSNIMDVAFRGVPTDFTTGIAAGTLISFPVAILTLAIRGLRAKRQAD